ncbi:TonB-dependent receptor plug domain-containing protein [Shewanella scandinavica]
MLMNSLLAKSVRLALIGGATVAALSSTTALAAEEDGANKVERIEVTGSRIKRVDMEGPSPVQVFDKAFIEATGTQTVADFLFQSNFAGPGLTSENATLAQGAGTANFDARGFGDDYTVFLLNGRRLPGSPVGGSAATDLNNIPMAAVERIEFLADGASAIYGADAISGVINIITKKDFDGLSVKAQYGQNLEHSDGERTSYELVAGSTGEKHSTLVAFDYFKQEVVEAVNRPLINSAVSPTGADGRSPAGFPGTWLEEDFSTAYPVADCPESSKRPTTVTEAGFECAYDVAPLYQAVPKSERFNLFASHHQEFSDNLSGFFEARYSRAKTEVRNGAAPGLFEVPASSPENTFGRDMLIYRRTVDAGPRSRDGVNTATNLAFGLDYRLNDSHTVSGYYAKSWVNQNQMGLNGQISKKGLSDAVAAGLIKLTELNPAELWTTEPHTAANGKKYWISIPTHRQAALTEEIANIGMNGDFEVMEGLGYAVGYETRKETYYDYTDIAQITADVAGGAASYGIGDREMKAAYAELAFTPIESLELSGALRYDDITTSVSDLGSKTTYKLAASWRPVDSLLLRASHATGFKAPALGQLFLGESFGVTSAIDTKACQADPVNGCSKRELQSKSGGNKDLKPEESTSYNFGFSWEAIEGLSITTDYWNIEVDGKIGSLGVQEIINNEDKYPQLVHRVGGNLYHPDAYVATNLQNLSSEKGRGIDFDIGYNFDLAGGTMSLGLKSSYLIEHLRQSSATQPLCDDAGTTSEPEWRQNLRASWETSDYGVSANARYIGETTDNPAGKLTGTCNSQDPSTIVTADSYTQIDLQAFYFLPTGTKLTVGLRNVFDEAPVYSEEAGGGWPFYDQALYDNMGRYMYLSLSHSF